MGKKKTNKEDVPASIAGFYYQILLACREITSLVVKEAAPETKVGIERGADVKVIHQSGNEQSIEAKFYGSKFNKYSQPIYHTIFNFYKNSRDDNSLVFETNVPIDDDTSGRISFAQPWAGISNEDMPKYIKYVKVCLIKEWIEKQEKEKTKTIKKKITEYCGKQRIAKNNHCKAIEHILDNHPTQTDFYDFDFASNSELECFIRKIQFKSRTGNLVKQIAISELKKEISANLNLITEKYEITTSTDLTSLLIDEFLLTTVEPTEEDTKRYQIKEEFTTLSIQYVLDLFKQTEGQTLKLIENVRLKNLIEKIEIREKEFFGKLTSMHSNSKINSETYEQIKYNYQFLRKNILVNIDSHGLKEFTEFFALTGHEGGNTIIKLLEHISILAIDQGFDIESINFGTCPMANVVFFDSVNYSYKYSDDEDLESFIHTLMSDTVGKGYKDMLSNKLPILTDCRIKKACEEEDIILSLTTNIANIQATENDLLLFSELDYRCVGCFKLKQFADPNNVTFSNCKNINITTDIDDN